MNRDNDDRSRNHGATAPGKGANNSGTHERQEPTFSRFDDDDFEEPERDADYVSDYHTEELDDDEDYDEDEYDEEDELDTQDDRRARDAADADIWQAKGNYFDDDEPRNQSWPLSLIAVAVVALVLLAAGGYGVMQQRAATEDELRELRAALATTSTTQGVDVRRGALQKLQQAYDSLASEAEALRLENRALTDTVSGLENQLDSQQTFATSTPATATSATPIKTEPTNDTVAIPAPKPEPQPAPAAAKPAAPKSTVVGVSGPWFVNFGSYAEREVAQSWAAKLRPGTGEVIVMPTTSGGKTLYRLRVIGLTDSASAKQVARKLETDLDVSKLWVGKE